METLAIVHHVVDGDTLWLVIPGSPSGHRPVKCRIAEIDAAERRHPTLAEGEAARVALEQWLAEADYLTVWESEYERDKYGRILVHLTRWNFGQPPLDAGHWMIAKGLAKRYHPNVRARRVHF